MPGLQHGPQLPAGGVFNVAGAAKTGMVRHRAVAAGPEMKPLTEEFLDIAETELMKLAEDTSLSAALRSAETAGEVAEAVQSQPALEELAALAENGLTADVGTASTAAEAAGSAGADIAAALSSNDLLGIMRGLGLNTGEAFGLLKDFSSNWALFEQGALNLPLPLDLTPALVKELIARSILVGEGGEVALSAIYAAVLALALAAEQTEAFNVSRYKVFDESGKFIEKPDEFRVQFVRKRREMVKQLDQISDDWQDVPSSLSWSELFGGAFMPVEPAENIKLTVKSGRMPTDMSGVYMRVGPNVQLWPPKKRTSVIDGDGMVHSIRFNNGEATYHCQYMETPMHLYERYHQMEWFSRIGELNSRWGIAKTIASVEKNALAGLDLHESGTANTAIVFTDGKLWALNEMGAPFRFALDEDGKPESLGLDTHHDTHRKPMSAHPKVDYKTGEVFFHGRPRMGTFFVARAVDGKVVDHIELEDIEIGFHHDVFLTENYFIIIDGSTRFNPIGLASDDDPLLNFNEETNMRLGVFDRSSGALSKDAVTWIEAPVPAEISHGIYAEDDGHGKITMWAPLSFGPCEDSEDQCRTDALLGGLGLSYMHRIEADVATKNLTIHEVHGAKKHFTEFPRIRDDSFGARTRYGYSAMQSEGLGQEFNFTGLLKWDFKEDRLVGEIHFPDGVVGGEPVFIPKEKEIPTRKRDLARESLRNFARDLGFSRRRRPEDRDDEGYLGLFLWDEEKRESTYAIFDAKSFSSTPVAELSVPRRVPLGFHATWITEDQFQQQLELAS